jgi:hypothetical protein
MLTTTRLLLIGHISDKTNANFLGYLLIHVIDAD